MRRDLFLSAIVVWATSSLAMPSFAQSAAETPRVTGQEAAAEATIILNEVNIDNYPDVRIFATVLRDGQPLTGLRGPLEDRDEIGCHWATRSRRVNPL